MATRKTPNTKDNQESLFNTRLTQGGRIEFHHSYVAANAPDTSVKAAKDVLGRTGSQRRRIYEYIMAQGENGATDNEMHFALGIITNSLTPRRLELQDAGLIVDSGKRRRTSNGSDAIVWVMK